MKFNEKIFGCRELFKSMFLKIFTVLICSGTILSQSTDQMIPTPVTSSEINGQIAARDIGDARLTSFYYVFNGNRGDVFVNVVTKNFNGDIDIFTADALQPKTKITVYAGSSNNETGRVVYMRQPERLILRVQGRTPNDDPALFSIKFAGSFEPLPASLIAEETEKPKVETEINGAVRVNSVGTIIEEPATDPDEKSETASEEKASDETARKTDAAKREIPTVFDPTKKSEKSMPEDLSILNPRVNASETGVPEKSEKEVTVNIEEKPDDTSAVVRIERETEETPDSAESEKAEETKRLRNISLKVRLKTGARFERTMNEVLSVNVIKTVLTIVTSDGKIHEFSIFDVDKMTID